MRTALGTVQQQPAHTAARSVAALGTVQQQPARTAARSVAAPSAHLRVPKSMHDPELSFNLVSAGQPILGFFSDDHLSPKHASAGYNQRGCCQTCILG